MADFKPGEVRFNKVVPQPGLDRSPSVHPFHELVYILKGSYAVRLGAETWHAVPGEAFLYPAETEHLPRYHQDLTALLLAVQWLGCSSPVPLTQPLRAQDRSGSALCAIQWLSSRYPPQTAGERALLRKLVWLMLYELWGFPARLEQAQPIQTAVSVLRHGFMHPFSIRELAAMVELSPSHLAHRFRKETGHSPAKYLKQLRIKQAYLLLHNTQLTLKEIAGRVGYRNAFHLSNLIKRTFGKSPRQLRSLASPTPQQEA